MTVSERAWLVVAAVWAVAFLIAVAVWLQGGQPTWAGNFDPQAAGRGRLIVRPPMPPEP